MQVLEQYHHILEIPFTVTPWNIFFIFKTKVLLPQAYVTLTDFGDSV